MSLRAYLLKTYSTSTLHTNLYNIKRFTDYFGERAAQATYGDVLRYIEHLRKNHDLHPKTLRHCLYAVKVYFNYLLATGRRQDHPCRDLYLKDKINKQVQVDTLHSPESLEAFLESYTAKNTHLEKRGKVIISLLIYQGLTVSEIAELKVQDIDLDKAIVFIKGSNPSKTGKSPKSRTLPLKAKQILMFYHYLQQSRTHFLCDENTEWFIVNSKGASVKPHTISRIINKNRTEKIQPIKIRQSVIANLLKRENDTRVVQEFAGHRRASTTTQYKQTELEALQTAVNQYHPVK